MTTMDKIREHRSRLEALKARKATLAGQLEQMKAQHAEDMRKLKEEFGVETLDEARAEIKRLQAQVAEDEAKTEELLRKAEQALK